MPYNSLEEEFVTISKEPADVIDDRCKDCGHTSLEHGTNGCTKCECDSFSKPLKSGNRAMARPVDPRSEHISKENHRKSD